MHLGGLRTQHALGRDRDRDEQQPDQRAGDARAGDEEVMCCRERHRAIIVTSDEPRNALARMSFSLSATEIRVLGCLLEKQRTTPDAYPLSLNALRLACNQSTNRDPVVDYDEATIRDALHRLERRGLVRLASGSRAAKYRHLLAEALPMDEAEQAVMCVLMLRGRADAGRAQAARRADARVRRPRGRARHARAADRARAGRCAWRAARGRRRSATSSCSQERRCGGSSRRRARRRQLRTARPATPAPAATWAGDEARRSCSRARRARCASARELARARARAAMRNPSPSPPPRPSP